MPFLFSAVCAASLAFVNPDPDAVRMAVDNQLRAMTAACLAGDRDAYMACIYKGDSEWMNEQLYFANDMAKKKPAECAAAVGELALSDGSATGTITWTWTMPGAAQREVSFEARFIESDAQWLYAGETWEKHEAPGILVLCDPGLEELANNTIEAFGAIRAKVEETFELTDADLPRKTQKIKLYGSMKHLQHSICLSYKDSLGGWNEPRESIKLLAGPRTGVRGLKNLLGHEYGHVATFVLGPTSNTMPWWALEGVAELSAREATGGSRRDKTVERWARAGNLAPWDELADFENCKPKWMGHVYTQGNHMLTYITDRFGAKARNVWLRALSNAKTIDEATQEAAGMPWSQLADEWRASLPAEGEEEPEAPAAPDPAKGT